MKWHITVACIAAMCIGQTTHGAQKPTQLPAFLAAAEGFSAARLERLDKFMRSVMESGTYLGAVTLIARNGKIVDWHAYGHRDLAKKMPMSEDAIFRIYSMTKTVASVAVLILMEEGKFALDDPVANYLPEFKNMQVFAGGTASAPKLRPAARPITIRQLLTHTGGFATSGKDGDQAVIIFNRFDLHQSPTLKAYVEYVARQPLGVDPGEKFNYDGVSLEVLSRLVEVISGKPFDVFLQERILGPLEMTDTGFSVPAEKRARIPDMSSTDADGRLIPSPANTAITPGKMMNPYPSGAGGLYSTAPDYARFCQMLLNGGSINGVSILGRKTVELMMMNHLTQLDPPVTSFSNAEGFGLGGSVVLDVARRGRLGSMGQFGWSGAGSTYYTIDREENLIVMLLMQHLPQDLPKDPPRINVKFYNLVYQSLVK